MQGARNLLGRGKRFEGRYFPTQKLLRVPSVFFAETPSVLHANRGRPSFGSQEGSFLGKNIPKGVVREDPLEGCILLEEECLFPLPITAFCGIPPFPGLRFTKGKESWWVFSTLLDRSDSSVVERLSYKQLVGGSNPSPVILLLFLGKTIPER